MWSTRTFTPFLSPHSLVKELSNQLSYAGMKWLHCKMRSVVPLIWAGAWRASLFLLRPGDLTDPSVAAHPDRYLFDLIKHGGATIGRPGMPAFGAQLSDDDIAQLVAFVRTLASRDRR